ncbi:MAG: Fe-S cluster assembly protein NifU [Lentisphaerae bacterium GWF2_52_8]|nr:MAG: Fe-S cluster assembly protein NifU [Lentisphaerae bacterium GWF2_52_8]
MWNYNQKVMDHFLNPRNVGEIEKPDAEAEVGNMSCGDALKLFLKLDDQERIAEAKFKTFGCASAIASSSALTELIKGMTLDEAAKVTNKDIVALLGELPEEKMHCSVMGMEALQAAIANYQGTAATGNDDDHEGRIVCHCFGVTDAKIRKIAKENKLRKAEDVRNYSKAGGGCGCCLDQIQEILDGLWKETDSAPLASASKTEAGGGMSFVQKVLKIQEIVEKEIRPLLEKDGGNIELVDVQGNVVQVRLKGRCAMCHASSVTLENTVQARLREYVSQDIVVKNVR